jgi:hypothetical protein
MDLAENGAIETLVPGHGGIARDETECIERLLRDGLYLAELEGRVAAAVDEGRSFESMAQDLMAMDYTGKDSTTYPTETFHRDNIRFAFEGVMVERR